MHYNTLQSLLHQSFLWSINLRNSEQFQSRLKFFSPLQKLIFVFWTKSYDQASFSHFQLSFLSCNLLFCNSERNCYAKEFSKVTCEYPSSSLSHLICNPYSVNNFPCFFKWSRWIQNGWNKKKKKKKSSHILQKISRNKQITVY